MTAHPRSLPITEVWRPEDHRRSLDMHGRSQRLPVWLTAAWAAAVVWLVGVTGDLALPAHAQSKRTTLGRPRTTPTAPRIAVIADGRSELMARDVAVFAREANALLEGDFPGFRLPERATLVGDYTQARAAALLEQALADPQVDMVVGFGLYLGRVAGARGDLPKPVVLPYAIPELQGLPVAGGLSETKNLTFVGGLLDLEREMRRFHEIVHAKRMVWLIDRYIAESARDLQAMLAEATAHLGLDVTIVSADPTASAMLAAIPEDAEAVYLGPFVQLPLDQVQALIDGINARKLPSYAAAGRSWVERGALTTLVPKDDLTRRMRRVALMLQGIAGGELPESFSTGFQPRAELVINMKTVRALGTWPRFALLTEAVLLNDTAGNRGPLITLRNAVQRAVRANLDLHVERARQRTAHERVSEAWGALMPQLDAKGDFLWRDPDVANPFAGAERTLSWGLDAQQVLYSPLATAAIGVRKAQKQAADYSVRAVELDITQQAAIAYIHVLRAMTAERINKENLMRVRTNLALAETRQEVGAGGREEVYRWQIEIADRRAQVIQASANRNQAEIALNRVLNRPLEAPFQITDVSDPKTGLLIDPRTDDLVSDPWTFRRLRAFLAAESLNNAPELKQLDRAIGAQDGVVGGRQQQLFVPDVLLSGGFSHPITRGGAGSTSGPGQPQLDDFTWQFGLGARFNLFDGSRYPAIRAEQARLLDLTAQRSSLRLALQERVRASLHQAAASRATSRLKQEASEAAQHNLELVTDAYRRGVANVITLVDAQNQALLSELAATNAYYDLLVDFVRVQRAVGRFGFLQTPAERNDFFARFDAYLQRERKAGSR